MDDGVTPYWGGNIIDEEELNPDERSQLPWNDPDDRPYESPYYFDERALGLPLIAEEDWDSEEDVRPTYKEEPDINLIYGYYEESEFY